MSWQGYGRRINQAIAHLQADLLPALGRRFTLEEFGAWVARCEDPPRITPYGASAVSLWTSEGNEPSLRTFEAIASVCGYYNATWLTFGLEDGKQRDLALSAVPKLLKKKDRPALSISRKSVR